MNFNEWAESIDYDFENKFGHSGDVAKRSWEKCKEEVLKILKDTNNINWYDNDFGAVEAIDLSVVEEIQKL